MYKEYCDFFIYKRVDLPLPEKGSSPQDQKPVLIR
jgi:hypothetical protein